MCTLHRYIASVSNPGIFHIAALARSRSNQVEYARSYTNLSSSVPALNRNRFSASVYCATHRTPANIQTHKKQIHFVKQWIKSRRAIPKSAPRLRQHERAQNQTKKSYNTQNRDDVTKTTNLTLPQQWHASQAAVYISISVAHASTTDTAAIHSSLSRQWNVHSAQHSHRRTHTFLAWLFAGYTAILLPAALTAIVVCCSHSTAPQCYEHSIRMHHIGPIHARSYISLGFLYCTFIVLLRCVHATCGKCLCVRVSEDFECVIHTTDPHRDGIHSYGPRWLVRLCQNPHSAPDKQHLSFSLYVFILKSTVVRSTCTQCLCECIIIIVNSVHPCCTYFVCYISL